MTGLVGAFREAKRRMLDRGYETADLVAFVHPADIEGAPFDGVEGCQATIDGVAVETHHDLAGKVILVHREAARLGSDVVTIERFDRDDADRVIVYGCSDDLMEVDGAVQKEIVAPMPAEATLRFDDGTEVDISYNTRMPACWDVRLAEPGDAVERATWHCAEEHDVDGAKGYSDVLELWGDFGDVGVVTDE